MNIWIWKFERLFFPFVTHLSRFMLIEFSFFSFFCFELKFILTLYSAFFLDFHFWFLIFLISRWTLKILQLNWTWNKISIFNANIINDQVIFGLRSQWLMAYVQYIQLHSFISIDSGHKIPLSKWNFRRCSLKCMCLLNSNNLSTKKKRSACHCHRTLWNYMIFQNLIEKKKWLFEVNGY